MSEIVHELFGKAKQLSIDERIELAWNALRADHDRPRFIDRGWPEVGDAALADPLSMSTMIPEAEWQRIWSVEARRRIEAYERGEAEAEDFAVVMERMRKEFLD